MFNRLFILTLPPSKQVVSNALSKGLETKERCGPIKKNTYILL